MPWYFAFPFATVMNALITPICWFFLSTVHLLLLKLAKKPVFSWYNRFFEFFIKRARTKLQKIIEKWGWPGLVIFIAIPLPFTGAWTGTLGAWILGMSGKRTMLAVILGLTAAGIIVTAVVTLGIGAFNFFVKNM